MKSTNNKAYLWLVPAALVVVAVIWAGSILLNKPGKAGVDLSQPASLSLIGPSLNTAAVGELSTIRWTSNNYGADTVSVNVLRKVSDDPVAYKLVKVIASSAPDNGSLAWMPTASETGPDTYIQIGCASGPQACTASPVGAL